MTNNGWDEYKRLVLKELEENSKRLLRIEKRLNKIDQHIIEHKTKIYVGTGILSVMLSATVAFLFKVLSQ
tara:strand:+ start:289 stop:498 length:210 start_codon:yes stop_codon:yes gene_type:complete